MGDRACVVVLEHDRVLMVRQTYRGETFWTFPGGGLLPDESPGDAAIREAKEEVGLDVEIITLLCQTVRATTTGTYYCYLARVVGGEARLGHDPELPVDAQELHATQWYTLEQVREHPEVDRIWELFVAKCRRPIDSRRAILHPERASCHTRR